MGWSSGTQVCIEIWEEVREWVPKKSRAKRLAKIIGILQQHDWDCEDEIEDEWEEAKDALRIALPFGEEE